MSSDAGENYKEDNFKQILKQQIKEAQECLKRTEHSTESSPIPPGSDYYQDNHKNSVLQFQITSAQEYLRRVEANSKVESNSQTEVEILRLRNEIRKLKLRLAQRKRIAGENYEQREHRLATLRTNQRKRLANETPEQREKRLQAMREYAVKRTRKGDQVAEPFISV